MEEYISADPVKFDHSLLFKLVQTLTLDFRLNDPFASLVGHVSPSSPNDIFFFFLFSSHLLLFFSCTCVSKLYICFPFFFNLITGLVLARPDIRPRRILCPVRSPRLLSPFVLPGRLALPGRTWDDDRSYFDSLFLCLLRLTRARKSVSIRLFRYRVIQQAI